MKTSEKWHEKMENQLRNITNNFAYAPYHAFEPPPTGKTGSFAMLIRVLAPSRQCGISVFPVSRFSASPRTAYRVSTVFAGIRVPWPKFGGRLAPILPHRRFSARQGARIAGFGGSCPKGDHVRCGYVWGRGDAAVQNRASRPDQHLQQTDPRSTSGL